MKTTKHSLDFAPRTKLRLSEIERVIRKHRIIVPPPSRRTLIALCEDGTLKAAPHEPGTPYLVFESSFLDWIKRLDSGSAYAPE